ncbi:MAG: hypothetical protein KDK70_44730, partial [Myxococcales bacterium]|nr:hypothetical protein [Myxococcales bacterium]
MAKTVETWNACLRAVGGAVGGAVAGFRRRSVVGSAYYFVALAVVVVGLAGAYLLVPRERELGLMYLEDKEFDAARATYEARLAAGDTSVAVVLPLVDV